MTALVLAVACSSTAAGPASTCVARGHDSGGCATRTANPMPPGPRARGARASATPTGRWTATAASTCATTTSRDALRLRHRPPVRHDDADVAADRGALAVRPRPAAPGLGGHGRRRAGGLHQARPPRAADHPGRAAGRADATSRSVVHLRRRPRARSRTPASATGWPAADEVVTMDQPHMAPWWFAANDHPRDKATFDITRHRPGRRPGRLQRAAGRAHRVRAARRPRTGARCTR